MPTYKKFKPQERRDRLLEIVLSGHTRVDRLSEIFSVSEASIRRDLATLSKQRRLVRTYGGASGVGPLHEAELSLEQRIRRRRPEKEAIAKLAARYIDHGDSVFLDSGTTTAALARQLRSREDLCVTTNNLVAASYLSHCRGIKLSLIGGDLRPSSMSTYGAIALMALRHLTFDKAFLGADGVVADLGLCEASAAQSYLKECVIDRAAQIFILTDSDKLGRRCQQNWTPLARPWTLITDNVATPSHLGPFEECNHIDIQVASLGPEE